MQMPVFLILFFAPVYVPLDLLDGLDPRGRVRQPADARPRGGAGLLAGTPREVAPAFAAGLALVGLFSVWALRGLRKAETAG